jgi:hypothetical protein
MEEKPDIEVADIREIGVLPMNAASARETGVNSASTSPLDPTQHLFI